MVRTHGCTHARMHAHGLIMAAVLVRVRVCGRRIQCVPVRERSFDSRLPLLEGERGLARRRAGRGESRWARSMARGPRPGAQQAQRHPGLRVCPCVPRARMAVQPMVPALSACLRACLRARVHRRIGLHRRQQDTRRCTGNGAAHYGIAGRRGKEDQVQLKALRSHGTPTAGACKDRALLRLYANTRLASQQHLYQPTMRSRVWTVSLASARSVRSAVRRAWRAHDSSVMVFS